jgi:hypothetical protein
MSLFIAGQAFPRAEDFAVAKNGSVRGVPAVGRARQAVLWRASA